MQVTGSGLPAEGLPYRRSTAGNACEFYGGGNVNPYWYPLSGNCGGIGIGATDASIAALHDAAVYTLTGFNAAGSPVALGAKGTQTLRTMKRPLTLAEAVAATFPSITTSSPLASDAGGSITISGSGANPGTGAWVYLGLALTGGDVDSVDGDTAVAANGSFSKSLTLATPAPGSVIGREVRVMSRDAYGRAMRTHITY